MLRRIFVDAPSLSALIDILQYSPYKSIRPRRVPSSDIYPLVRYLLNPAFPPPFSWIRLNIKGDYKGRLGVVSQGSRILLLPKYDTFATCPDLLPLLVPLPFSPDAVAGDFGLYEVDPVCILERIELVDPYMDAAFLASARCLVESGHPDVLRAWKDV